MVISYQIVQDLKKKVKITSLAKVQIIKTNIISLGHWQVGLLFAFYSEKEEMKVLRDTGPQNSNQLKKTHHYFLNNLHDFHQ